VKIISWNVNGIRAAYKNGGLKLVEKLKADIYCFQETKAWPGEFPSDLFSFKKFLSLINPAKKRGYSGTAIFTRKKPKKIETKLGMERFDNEGRFLRLDFKNFTLINIYLPHGGREKENLGYKLKVYDYLLKYLRPLRNQNLVLIGDFNIAHQEIDLARPQQNKNNTMFTPQERKQIQKLLDLGFADTFRIFHKAGGCYTWWPYFANARQRNLGWRIDYAFVSKKLTPKVENAFILPQIKGSDHCPIGIEINFENGFCG
jgi:exodeoxyribonuclease-3